jgi:hypothetical protein
MRHHTRHLFHIDLFRASGVKPCRDFANIERVRRAPLREASKTPAVARDFVALPLPRIGGDCGDIFAILRAFLDRCG